MFSVQISLLFAIFLLSSVSALDNGIAPRPPMGWSSWERFGCTVDCKFYSKQCINAQLLKTMANRLRLDGYLKLGYNYLNVDDCWSDKRRNSSSHELVTDPNRFPDGGIETLAQFAHKSGLRLGIYGNCGSKTPSGYPAQLKPERKLADNYFKLDAETLAKWQVDAFKFDNFNLNPARSESICPNMTRQIEATGRKMLINCRWPGAMLEKGLQPDWELARGSCNLVRYHKNIQDSWLSVLSLIDSTIELQDVIKNLHGPNFWFDPDQLLVGNFGLSLEQAQAQMAIWSIWSAPLYISTDLRTVDEPSKLILQNQNLIQVDQDSLGVFGLMVAELGDYWAERVQAFVKPVEPFKNGCPSFVVVYLNRASLGSGREVGFKLRQLLQGSAIELATARYNSLNSIRDEENRAGKDCLRKITNSMTKVANEQPAQQQANREITLIDQSVHYEALDLISNKALGQVPLNGDLILWVNLSGVRAVKLVEV